MDDLPFLTQRQQDAADAIVAAFPNAIVDRETVKISNTTEACFRDAMSGRPEVPGRIAVYQSVFSPVAYIVVYLDHPSLT